MLAISMIPYIIIHLISEIVFCTVHSRFKNLSKILQNTKVTKRFRVKKQKEIKSWIKNSTHFNIYSHKAFWKHKIQFWRWDILCFHACVGYITFSGFTSLFALLKVHFFLKRRMTAKESKSLYKKSGRANTFIVWIDKQLFFFSFSILIGSFMISPENFTSCGICA